MKVQNLGLGLALVLTACSSTRAPRESKLNAEVARMVARDLANERARALYGTEPFRDDAAARFLHGKWVWSDRQACGSGDMEAMVVLAPDGTPRSVDVTLLYSQPLYH